MFPRTSAFIASLLIVVFVNAYEPQTRVSIDGAKFKINDQWTYAGRTWNGISLEGLLLNSAHGASDIRRSESRNAFNVGLSRYPAMGCPVATCKSFSMPYQSIESMALLAVTINLQGGSPQGYSKSQPWHNNSAFDADGNIRDDYAHRLEQVIERCDALGMVVIVGYFLLRQDERLKDEQAVIRAVDMATNWLLERGYRNVLVEVNNECNVKAYDHEILKPNRVHELIERVKSTQKDGRTILVGTSYGGGAIPGANVVQASDFLLLHGNGVSDPQRIEQMVGETRAVEGYRPMPILFNEDDHFNFDQPQTTLSRP